MKTILPLFFFSSIVLLSCAGENSSSKVNSPGGEKSARTKALESGADLLQDKTPLNQMTTYLDGFHFYSCDMDGQMEAHHYVSKINEDVSQAVIFDGNGENAKIMGVEYILSEKLFKTLPEEEKKLWHSHVFEVKSGTLIAPGIPDAVEHELMEQLVTTYGKTFHTWHTDKDLELPMGIPMVMMGFTRDGQLRPQLVADRDKRFNISTEKKREQRKDIPEPKIVEGADAWQKGETKQLVISNRCEGMAHKK